MPTNKKRLSVPFTEEEHRMLEEIKNEFDVDKSVIIAHVVREFLLGRVNVDISRLNPNQQYKMKLGEA